MDNAEEVMQLLEEFSKIKPKDIPRELEDYLGYVAKTGDPVYQWTLIKHLFREKLITVITDFYESTLTVELPPCPNVEPFNYERMKTSLLERFDSFTSAPFTVQRICELLTNPRKEYNRADKYMRAIEKNILVVSTREPGSAKRSLECDSQCETVLNGIPEMRSIPEPGSLIHIPTDLPYLGAPPASNDVTVETTELNSTINDKLNHDIKPDVNPLESNDEITSKALDVNHDKTWETHDSALNENYQNRPDTKSDIISSELSPNEVKVEEVKCTESSIDDVENNLTDESTSSTLITITKENHGNLDMIIGRHNCETELPDSLDSSDTLQDCTGEQRTSIENEEIKSVSDENEVSSTPENIDGSPLIQEEVEDPTDSEAEATDTKLEEDAVSDINIFPDNEINSSESVQTCESNTVTISEITDVKSREINLECSEVTGTVETPNSPENSNTPINTDLDSPEISNTSLESGEVNDQNINLSTEVEQSENPDSSNDVCVQDKVSLVVVEPQQSESCIEADSVSESNSELSDQLREVVENIPQCQSNVELSLPNVENNSEVSLADVKNIQTRECMQSTFESPEPAATSTDEVVSVEQYSDAALKTSEMLSEIPSSSEAAQDMCDQEQREDSVIQSIPSILPDSQHQVEEISVDQSCDVEEEAMDVDDCSNQMMVSEGENESEPMDESDQLQS